MRPLRAESTSLPNWNRIERELRRRLVDWRSLLRAHVFKARGMLATLMAGKIVFTPEPAATDHAVRFRVVCGVANLAEG
jgi:hypothetical protein